MISRVWASARIETRPMAALGRLAGNAGRLNVTAAPKARDTASNVTHSASRRHTFSGCDVRAAGYATKARSSLLGFLGNDGMFQSRQQRAAPRNDDGVDDDDYDLVEDEERVRRSSDTGLVRVRAEEREGEGAEKAKAVTETRAVDKGASVATSALDNVGSILTKTGLEVELDLSLKELTIEKLVLKDLGLVLEVKSKPQPQPGPPPPPEPPQ